MRALRQGLCLWIVAGAAVLAQAAEPPGAVLRDARANFQAGNLARAHELATSAATAERLDDRAEAQRLLALIGHRSRRFSEALEHSQRYVRLVNRRELKDVAAYRLGRQDMALIAGESCGLLGRPDVADRWFEYALQIRAGHRQQDLLWEPRIQLRWAAIRPLVDPAAVRHYRAAAAGAQQVLRRCDEHRAGDKGRSGEDVRQAATQVLVDAALATEQAPWLASALEALLATQHDPAARVETLGRMADAWHQAGSKDREVEFLERAVSESATLPEAAGSLRTQLLERLATARENLAQGRCAARGPCWRRPTTIGAKPFAVTRRWPRVPQATNGGLVIWTRVCSTCTTTTSGWAWPEACDAAQRLWELREKRLLRGDPARYRARTALGICLAKCERPVEARQALDEALAFWKVHKPVAYKDWADTLQSLAELERTDGEYESAQALLERALRLRTSTPSDNVGLIECLIALGNVHSARGRYDTAITRYRDAEQACGRADCAGRAGGTPARRCPVGPGRRVQDAIAIVRGHRGRPARAGNPASGRRRRQRRRAGLLEHAGRAAPVARTTSKVRLKNRRTLLGARAGGTGRRQDGPARRGAARPALPNVAHPGAGQLSRGTGAASSRQRGQAALPATPASERFACGARRRRSARRCPPSGPAV